MKAKPTSEMTTAEVAKSRLRKNAGGIIGCRVCRSQTMKNASRTAAPASSAIVWADVHACEFVPISP